MSILDEGQDLGAWRLESDLASLACQTAIEMDNLILGRLTTLDAANRLISAISESIPKDGDPFSPTSLLDPTVVLAFNRAIGDVVPGETPTRADVLVLEIIGKLF